MGSDPRLSIGRVTVARPVLEAGRGLHDRLLIEIVPRELPGQSSITQHEDAIADGQKLRQVAGHQQERRAGAREPADQVVDLRLCPDVDPACWLVQQEQDDLRQQELADHDLLLISATQVRDKGVDRGGLDAQVMDKAGDDSPLRPPVDDPEPIQELVQRCQRGVLGDGPFQYQALELAVLCHQPEAFSDRILGGCEDHAAPMEQDIAAQVVGWICTEDGLEQFGPSGTHQSGDADDLSPAHRQRHVLQDSRPAQRVTQPLKPEDLFAQLHGHFRIQGLEIAPDHHADQLAARDLLGYQRPHHLPIPHHGDPVDDLEDLTQPMRDVDHGHVVLAQAPDHAEQVFHLAIAQRRGRLVHDEDTRVQAQRLGDLDELALADPQAFDGPVGVDIQPQLRHQRLGRRAHRSPVQGAQPCLVLAPEEDVLVHRQLGDQVQFLVDHRDAAVLGLARVVKRDRLPVEQHRAIEFGIDTAHDLHERGLARAVLAYQTVDLARVHVEGHVLERDNAGEPLGDAAHAQDGRRVADARWCGVRRQGVDHRGSLACGNRILAGCRDHAHASGGHRRGERGAGPGHERVARGTTQPGSASG